MSRIRLEWNIESQKIDQGNGEDFLQRRARRRNLIRFSILIAILLLLLAATGALVRKRLPRCSGTDGATAARYR